jgi:hypothetical protein
VICDVMSFEQGALKLACCVLDARIQKIRFGDQNARHV